LLAADGAYRSLHHLLFCISFWSVPAKGGNAEGLPPGPPANQLDTSAGAAVGNINGVKLSIPHYYLLSGVQYRGEEPLMMKPRTFIPTFDTEIEDFECPSSEYLRQKAA
jgi:hypothetical protein